MKSLSPYSSPEFRSHLYVVPDAEQEEALDIDDGLGCMRGVLYALLFELVFGVLFYGGAMLARWFQ